MKGSCNCGNVKFEISGEVTGLYQCHCKLCQKQSGSTSNTATIIQESDFNWLSGLESIGHWKKDSGFTSHFCKTCGCPVPNQLRGMPYYWIPMGLVEEVVDDDDDENNNKLKSPTVVAHLNCNSKASWDTIHPTKTETMYEEMPETIESFLTQILPKADDEGTK